MKSSTVLLIGVAIAAALYGGKIIRTLAPANAASVTTTKKEGITGGSLNTTPIKTSAVAWVSSQNVTASRGQGTANDGGFTSSLSQSRSVPFANARSAYAAFTAPIRPQYAPTPYANLQAR